MKIKLGKIFNWEIKFVFNPEPVYVEYTDIGTQLIGYSVKIVYKYHGETSAFFSVDIDKFNLRSRPQAYNCAYRYYNKQLSKIQER